jgi:hypothetical protein
MCMNCGCGQVDDRHGNDANIVAEDIRRAASANKQDVSETVRNLETSLRGELATSGAGGWIAGSTQAGSSKPQGAPRR